jgi:hypothetical protein
MKDLTTILAKDKDGKYITSEQVEQWLQNPNKENNKQKLADLFYDRFYGRYLKPFDIPGDEYRKYKSGFAIMTSCCLLIETFVSFTVFDLINTYKNSERCFGYFFRKYSDFNIFAKDGLTIEQYRDLNFGIYKNNSGLPKEFYNDVRNGILHNGETRNGWKIRRDQSTLFDEATKIIDANIFMDKLENVIDNFRKDLINSNFDNDQIWITYKARLQNLIDMS